MPKYEGLSMKLPPLPEIAPSVSMGSNAPEDLSAYIKHFYDNLHQRYDSIFSQKSNLSYQDTLNQLSEANEDAMRHIGKIRQAFLDQDNRDGLIRRNRVVPLLDLIHSLGKNNLAAISVISEQSKNLAVEPDRLNALKGQVDKVMDGVKAKKDEATEKQLTEISKGLADLSGEISKSDIGGHSRFLGQLKTLTTIDQLSLGELEALKAAVLGVKADYSDGLTKELENYFSSDGEFDKLSKNLAASGRIKKIEELTEKISPLSADHEALKKALKEQLDKLKKEEEEFSKNIQAVRGVRENLQSKLNEINPEKVADELEYQLDFAGKQEKLRKDYLDSAKKLDWEFNVKDFGTHFWNQVTEVETGKKVDFSKNTGSAFGFFEEGKHYKYTARSPDKSEIVFQVKKEGSELVLSMFAQGAIFGGNGFLQTCGNLFKGSRDIYKTINQKHAEVFVSMLQKEMLSKPEKRIEYFELGGGNESVESVVAIAEECLKHRLKFSISSEYVKELKNKTSDPKVDNNERAKIIQGIRNLERLEGDCGRWLGQKKKTSVAATPPPATAIPSISMGGP